LQIQQLKEEIEDEKKYNNLMLAEEHASLICQKALFTHKNIFQTQQKVIAGQDMRDHPDGHIVVSKEEQTEAITHALLKKDAEYLRKKRLEVSKRGSQQSWGEESRESNIPSPNEEKYLVEIERIKWQLIYEKRL
jgi:hypothetical protein